MSNTVDTTITRPDNCTDIIIMIKMVPELMKISHSRCNKRKLHPGAAFVKIKPAVGTWHTDTMGQAFSDDPVLM